MYMGVSDNSAYLLGGIPIIRTIVYMLLSDALFLETTMSSSLGCQDDFLGGYLL